MFINLPRDFVFSVYFNLFNHLLLFFLGVWIHPLAENFDLFVHLSRHIKLSVFVNLLNTPNVEEMRIYVRLEQVDVQTIELRILEAHHQEVGKDVTIAYLFHQGHVVIVLAGPAQEEQRVQHFLLLLKAGTKTDKGGLERLVPLFFVLFLVYE